jgi:hypothetical protein
MAYAEHCFEIVGAGSFCIVSNQFLASSVLNQSLTSFQTSLGPVHGNQFLVGGAEGHSDHIQAR